MLVRAAGHVGMAGAIPSYPVMEVPSSRRAETKQNKRQMTDKKQVADNDYEVTGLEGTSYRREGTKLQVRKGKGTGRKINH